jgi:hypothetical protein
MSYSLLKSYTRLPIYLLIFIALIGSKVSAQDLLKLIPANSSGVVTMNGEAFFKKIDLEQINRLEMFQDMDERTQGKKGDKYQEYSKLYKAPTSLGLNINSKSYIFFGNSIDTTDYGMRYTYTGLTMSLLKSSKFESFIKKVSDQKATKFGSYKFCKIEDGAIVAWNKKQMLVLNVSGYGENREEVLFKLLKQIINQSANESIKNNKNFIATQSQTFDFNYWMNFESTMNGLLPVSYMTLPIFKDLPFVGADFYKGYFLDLNLNFNNGDITIDAMQTLSDESSKKMKDVYGKGINPEFVKYLHKDHLLGLLSYSINMKGLKPMLDTALADSVKDQLNEGFIGLLYESKLKKDSKLNKLQLEIDSMYTDLYPAYQYDTTAYTEPAEYDTTYYQDDYYGTDTTAINEEQINEDYVDTMAVDMEYYEDSTYTDSYSKEDSISNAKNDRIDAKRKELDERKKALLQAKVKELNLKKDFLFDLFQGDAIGAITDYYWIDKKYKTFDYDEENLKPIEVEKTKKEIYPEFFAGFTLNNTVQAKKFLTSLTKDSFLLKQNTYYIIPAEQKLFVTISNNLLIITNNEAIVKENFKGYSEKERISSDLQATLLHKTSAFHVNIKDIFAKLPYDNMSKEKQAMYSLLMNSFGTLLATSDPYVTNMSKSDMSLKLTNKIDNSFYEIFRIINEVYKMNRNKF